MESIGIGGVNVHVETLHDHHPVRLEHTRVNHADATVPRLPETEQGGMACQIHALIVHG